MQARSQLAPCDREVRFFVYGRADLIFGLIFFVGMPRNRQRTTAKAAWSEEDLQSAKTAIEGGLSKRKAAKQYNIPFTTLRDRLKNENMSNPRLGRKPVFTPEQETEIAEQVKLLGSLYYGLNVADLRKLVYKYAELVDEQRTLVSFSAIATTPTIAPSSKPAQRKRKQHATILTATPMKSILEDKEKKKKTKLNKTGKDDKSRPKKVVTQKKNKKIKEKSYKRRILQESSSESEVEEHLCDYDSDDEMYVNDENYNKCIICEEFGKNNELWYRCTICGLWSHAICSGWDSPDGYVCDLCLQK